VETKWRERGRDRRRELGKETEEKCKGKETERKRQKGRDRRRNGGKETKGKRKMGEICSRAVEGTASHRGDRGLLRKQRSIERIEVRRGHTRP
jgi:hypothetical protein